MKISVYSAQGIIQIITTMLVTLFFYTAISKLLEVEEFQKQLLNQILPGWSVPALLWLIPVTEILVSLLLVLAPTRTAGFYGSALLMLLFTGYVGLVLLNVFDRVPCSCGGIVSYMGFKAHFFFNLFFLVLSVIGIYVSHVQKKGGDLAASDL